MQVLLGHGVVPIINENDALADDEISVGDNDHLAAMVTSVVSADLLVILSRVDGVYAGGQGQVIPQVEVGSSVETHIKEELSESGVGGMAAKVSAAHLASQWSVPTVIANGTQSGTLTRVLAGDDVGTLFLPRNRKLSARKRWIAVQSRSRGTLSVDDGAKQAITGRGASLLPVGIVKVDGKFSMGARVEVLDEGGQAFAVGIASYSADDIRRLQGLQVRQIEDTLGYVYVQEIIHRDDMVLLD